MSNSLFQLMKCSWLWSAYFPFDPTTQTVIGVGPAFREGHSVRPQRPIHRRGKWLSINARTKMKRKMWRCSILIYQWATRNCRQSYSSTAYLLSNPPVYYVYHREILGFRHGVAEIFSLPECCAALVTNYKPRPRNIPEERRPQDYHPQPPQSKTG
jgi:hypothetical protein